MVQSFSDQDPNQASESYQSQFRLAPRQYILLSLFTTKHTWLRTSSNSQIDNIMKTTATITPKPTLRPDEISSHTPLARHRFTPRVLLKAHCVLGWVLPAMGEQVNDPSAGQSLRIHNPMARQCCQRRHLSADNNTTEKRFAGNWIFLQQASYNVLSIITMEIIKKRINIW